MYVFKAHACTQLKYTPIANIAQRPSHHPAHGIVLKVVHQRLLFCAQTLLFVLKLEAKY